MTSYIVKTTSSPMQKNLLKSSISVKGGSKLEGLTFEYVTVYYTQSS